MNCFSLSRSETLLIACHSELTWPYSGESIYKKIEIKALTKKKTASVHLGSLSGCWDANSNESSPLFYKTACSCPTHSAIFCSNATSFSTTPQGQLLQKIKERNLSLVFSPHCYGCHLKPYFHLPLLAVNKVTTFSKGCLIKQSAVVTGPPRLLSGSSLHHCLRWWDLSCLFWNSIANMGLFLSRYAPSFPRKKKQHFHRGKRRQALWQEPAPVFRNDFSLAGST